MNRQVVYGIGLVFTVGCALILAGSGRSDSTSAVAAPAAPAASSEIERAEALLLELTGVETELNAANEDADHEAQAADAGVIAKLNESAGLNTDVSRKSSARNKEIHDAESATHENIIATQHYQTETSVAAASATAKEAEIREFEAKIEDTARTLATCQSLKGRLEAQLAEQEGQLKTLTEAVGKQSKTAAHLRMRCAETRQEIDRLVKVIPELEAEERSLKRELARKRAAEALERMRNPFGGLPNLPGLPVPHSHLHL